MQWSPPEHLETAPCARAPASERYCGGDTAVARDLREDAALVDALLAGGRRRRRCRHNGRGRARIERCRGSSLSRSPISTTYEQGACAVPRFCSGAERAAAPVGSIDAADRGERRGDARYSAGPVASRTRMLAVARGHRVADGGSRRQRPPVASASRGSRASPRSAATRLSTATALSVSSSIRGANPTVSQAASRCPRQSGHPAIQRFAGEPLERHRVVAGEWMRVGHREDHRFGEERPGVQRAVVAVGIGAVAGVRERDGDVHEAVAQHPDRLRRFRLDEVHGDPLVLGSHRLQHAGHDRGGCGREPATRTVPALRPISFREVAARRIQGRRDRDRVPWRASRPAR